MHRIKAPTTFEMTGSVIVTGLMIVVAVLLVQFLWRLSKVADQQEKLKRENVARADQVIEDGGWGRPRSYRTRSVTAAGTEVICVIDSTGVRIDRATVGASSGSERRERTDHQRSHSDKKLFGRPYRWAANLIESLSGTEQPVSIPERRNAI